MPRHTIDVQIAPTVQAPVERTWLRKVAKAALQGERLAQPTEVGILLTTDDEVSRLNGRYRGQQRSTDVLSFAFQEGDETFVAPPDGVRWLGEVVVSYPQAVRQAAEYGHSIEREIAFLTVHGVLHLLGYDHQKPQEEAAMFRRQEEILGALGLGRNHQ